MGIFEQFPYTNFHDLNLDWILHAIQSMDKKLDEFVASNVLSYADPIQWDIETQYAKNTVVVDPKTGTAYMSINPVPVGQLLTNKYYWQPIFNYEEIVNTLKKQIAAVQADQHDTISVSVKRGDLVWIVNTLYRVTQDLASGSKIIPDSNAEKITVEEAILNINTTKNIMRNTDGTITDTAGTITRNSDNIIDTANDAISVSGKTITNAAADSITNSSTNITDTASAGITRNAVTITDTASAGITRNAVTITDTATGDVSVSGKNITDTASTGIARNAVTITDTATGDVSVSGKNITDTASTGIARNAVTITDTASTGIARNAVTITDTATENYTENAKNKTENYTNHTENVEIDKECTVKNNYIIKNKDRIIDVYTLGSITNVKDFGAIGDGITDDYTSFSNAINATKNGDIIIVPYGNYLLSKNPYNVSNNVISTDPDVYTQWRKWIIATGTTFTGAGLGDVESGNGTFNSTFSTNPWLVVSGNNNLYNLNNIACPRNGALIADAKELAPIENYNNETHRWYSLEYRGASTGNELITNSSVELLNQVLNITANKGISTEIDVNNYTTDNSSGFSTGLFLTGRGAGKADTTAIDIMRDRDSTPWVNGISVRNSRNGIYINNVEESGIKVGESHRYSKPILTGKQLKNGGDCISFTRNTDTDPEGNFIICFNANETDPALFRVDINGNVFSRERNISAAVTPPLRETKTTEQQHFTTGEHTINFTAPNGYKIGLVAEVSTLGFVSYCYVIDVSENSFKVYNTSEGTGSIRYTLLFIPA